MNLREWALPVYTILIQLVTGMFLVLWIMRAVFHKEDNEKDLDEFVKIPVLIFFFTIVLGSIGAHFHLSHPLKSFLALSNLKTSWLSREIFFTSLMTLFTAVLLVRLWITGGSFRSKTILGWLAIVFGVITIWCMAFIYLLPTQVAWNSGATVFSYFGTMLLLGVTSLAVILLLDLGFTSTYNPESAFKKAFIFKKSALAFLITVFLAAIWVASANLYQVSILKNSPLESGQTSFLLLQQLYRPLVVFRIVLLVIGIAFFIVSSVRAMISRQEPNEIIVPMYLACLFVMIGEILERFLFYAVHVRIGI